jgi:hypothetical protein
VATRKTRRLGLAVRAARGFTTTVSDRAAALGARVRVQSRWLHAISVDAPIRALRVLAQDRDLRRVQPLGRFRLRSPNRLSIEQAPPVVPAPLKDQATCGAPGDDLCWACPRCRTLVHPRR